MNYLIRNNKNCKKSGHLDSTKSLACVHCFASSVFYNYTFLELKLTVSCLNKLQVTLKNFCSALIVWPICYNDLSVHCIILWSGTDTTVNSSQNILGQKPT